MKERKINWIAFGPYQTKIGGYSADEDNGKTHISADFVDWNDLIKLAEENDIHEVSLSGDWKNGPFKEYGYEGFGQKVPLSDIKEVVNLEDNAQDLKKREKG